MSLGWVGWALGTAAAWGLGTLTAKPATERLGPRTMFLGVAAAEGSAFAVLAVALGAGPIPADVVVVTTALLAGLAGILGYLFFYEGLRHGTVGLVGTVTGAYPGVTVVLGVVLLGETLSGPQALGVVFLVACVALLAYEPRASAPSGRVARLLSLLGFLSWGVWGLLAKVSVDAIGEPTLFVFYAIANFAVAPVYAALRPPSREPRGPASRTTVGLASFTIASGAAGVFALTFAYGEGPVSLVTPVAGSYPVVAALGAAALLRERLGPQVAAALVAFVAGLVLLFAV